VIILAHAVSLSALPMENNASLALNESIPSAINITETVINYSIPLPANNALQALNESILLPITTSTTINDSVFPSISIIYPARYAVIQRTSNDTGDIPIAGVFEGNPSAIEVRFNGGPWTEVSIQPTQNQFVGLLHNQSVGQGLIEARFADNHSITDSKDSVGLGDVFVIAGQSNAIMLGENLQTFGNSSPFTASVYSPSFAWIPANDPFYDGQFYNDRFRGEHTKGSAWPLVAKQIMQNERIPVAFIASAIGGTSILAWQKDSPAYKAMLGEVREATNGTMFVKAVLWFQGEQDTLDTSNQATVRGSYDYYKANFSKFASNLKSDINTSTIVAGQIGELIDGFANRNTVDNIRRAQTDIWRENQFVSPGPITYDIGPLNGGVHFTSDVEIDALAARWWIAIMCNVYHECKYKAPRIKQVGLSLTGKKVILLFESEEPLSLQGGSAEGFSFEGIENSKPAAKVALGDSNIVATKIVSDDCVMIILDTQLKTLTSISMGSFNDATGKNVIRGSESGLVAEPFSIQQVNETNVPAMLFGEPSIVTYPSWP